jgi:hypothetical protein
MGKRFQIGGVFLLWMCRSIQADPILPIETPHDMQPPSATPAQMDQDVIRLHTIHGQENPPSPPSPSPVTEALAMEAQEPRLYRAMVQMGLVVPWVWTHPPRSYFTTDLTTHVTALFRLRTTRPNEAVQGWMGARMAPFSGSGSVDGLGGRYNLYYWGPAFAIGRVTDLISKERDREKIRIEETHDRYPIRTVWFLSGGIGIPSVLAAMDPTTEKQTKELASSKGPYVGGTAVWAEFMYGRIYYGTVGVQPTVGFQYNPGMSFAWVSLSVGGWY